LSREIALRSYCEGDLDAMFRLDEECFEEPFRFTQAAMQRFAESRKARVVIAESAGAMAGFAILSVEGRWGYVVTLDVAEELRGHGLARQLMQALEQKAVEAECVVVGLHVFIGNEAAIRFYERAGFERAGDVPGFYGEGLNAWVYTKKLSPKT
jgi:ribosomal-protein-alanine N-acetyltransferase